MGISISGGLSNLGFVAIVRESAGGTANSGVTSLLDAYVISKYATYNKKAVASVGVGSASGFKYVVSCPSKAIARGVKNGIIVMDNLTKFA